MRAARVAFSRPPPGRRPRLPGFSTLNPPSRDSFIHLLTARRLTLYVVAASVCVIPPRTAFTTRFRRCACVVPSNLRASVFVLMYHLTHYALFGAHVSNFLHFLSYVEA